MVNDSAGIWYSKDAMKGPLFSTSCFCLLEFACVNEKSVGYARREEAPQNLVTLNAYSGGKCRVGEGANAAEHLMLMIS